MCSLDAIKINGILYFNFENEDFIEIKYIAHIVK